MNQRKNYTIHGNVRVSAIDLAELAIFYEDRDEKHKTRSIAALMQSAIQDLAEMIRENSEDSRQLHPDDAIETLEVFGILPRSKEFILGKLKEIKKRDPLRLNILAHKNEYKRNLVESLESNAAEQIEETRRPSFQEFHSTATKAYAEIQRQKTLDNSPKIPIELHSQFVEQHSTQQLAKTRPIEEQIDNDPFAKKWQEMPPNSDGGKYFREKWKKFVDDRNEKARKEAIKRSERRANA